MLSTSFYYRTKICCCKVFFKNLIAYIPQAKRLVGFTLRFKKDLIVPCVYLTVLFNCSDIFAQTDHILFQYYDLQQSRRLNPAAYFKAPLVFSMPLSSVALQYRSPISFNDFITFSGRSYTVDLQKLSGAVGSNNQLDLTGEGEVFSLFTQYGNFSGGIFINVKAIARATFPRELLDLLIEGNAATTLFGNSSELELNVSGNAFATIGLNFGFEAIPQKLTLGTNLKILSGIAGINSENVFNITTANSRNYPIEVSGNTQTLYASIFSNGKQGLASILNFENMGFAIDIGMRYQLNEKITISASVSNAFSIFSWKTNVRDAQYRLTEKSFRFSGLDLRRILLNNDFQGAIDEAKDQFDKNFSLKNRSDNPTSYTSNLPLKFYGGAEYKIAPKFWAAGSLGLTLSGGIFPSLSVNASRGLGDLLYLRLAYTVDTQSFNQIGAGFTAYLGGIQFYAMANNLIEISQVKSYKNVGFRLGINYLLGGGSKKKNRFLDKNDDDYEEKPKRGEKSEKKKRNKKRKFTELKVPNLLKSRERIRKKQKVIKN